MVGYGRPVSAHDHAGHAPHRSSTLAAGRLGATQTTSEVGAWTRIRAVLLSGYAWGVIAATVAYIALTGWWLTQDRTIPIYDAGDHLETALVFHQMLEGGNLLGPFNHESPYPPFALLVGALAVFVGGVNVASPIIGENLVFVPLLTLGCYQTGRLLFGPKAGLLAAIVALGTDLVTAQFHVFMIDAPEAAVVSVSIWLLLACEDFSRVGVSAVAGLAVGIGLFTKVQYAPFVMGIVLMALLRGGWRNARGLAAFAFPAVIVGVPWYVDHLSEFATFLHISTNNPISIPGDNPTGFTLAKYVWYFWNILNSILLAPLFALLIVGTVWMIVLLVRGRRERGHGARLEFFVGAFVAWLFITVTPSHDIRYGIPLLPYLAVIATGWIVRMPRAASWAAIALLAAGVIANTLGTTFSVGENVQLALVHPLPPGEEHPDFITFYSTEGFLVAGPNRDGDVPGLLEALHREGVSTVTWSIAQSGGGDFSFEGLLPLSRIAGLTPELTREPEFRGSANVATLIHEPVTAHGPPTCTRVSNGTGVWVVRYDVQVGKLTYYCPTRRPQFYGVGALR